MLRLCINKIENLIRNHEPIESDDDFDRVNALNKCLHKLQQLENGDSSDLEMKVFCRYMIGVVRAYHDIPSKLLTLVPRLFLQFTRALLTLHRHDMLSFTRAYMLCHFLDIELDKTPRIVEDLASEGLLTPESFNLIFSSERLLQLATALRSQNSPPLPHFVLAELYMDFSNYIPYDNFIEFAKDPALCREAHGLIENFDNEGINITPRLLRTMAREIKYSSNVLLAISLLQLHFLHDAQQFYSSECLIALISSARYCDCTNLIVTLHKYQLVTPELLITLCSYAIETKTDLSILIDCLDASKVLPVNSIDFLLMLLSFMPFIDAVQPAVIALRRFRKLDRETFQRILDEPAAALAIMLEKVNIYDLQTMVATPEFKSAHPEIFATIKKSIHAAIITRYVYLPVYRNTNNNLHLFFSLPLEIMDQIIHHTGEDLDPKVIDAIIRGRLQ